MVACAASAQTETARVQLLWSPSGVEVLGLETTLDPNAESGKPSVDSIAGSRIELLAGAAVVGSVPVRVPNILYQCLPDPETGLLSGGASAIDEIEFSVRVPLTEDVSALRYHDGFGAPKSAIEIASLPKSIAKGGLPTNKFIDNGPDDKRIVFAILGDGYQAAEMAQFRADAAAVMTGFLAEPPWSYYAPLINAYTVDVVSSQSGADHPFNGTFVNTALDASYNFPPIERLLTVNFSKAFQAASSVPSYDLALVIVNDPQYGGSGGPVSVVSVAAAAVDIAIHEIGHTFGGLADEYESACPGCPTFPTEPNVTNVLSLGQIPWTHWIELGTPLPTPKTAPYDGIIGLFEGAKYLPLGNYRPRQRCMMRSLADGFCPVCAEAHILEIYRTPGIDPILDASPDPGDTIEYVPGNPVTLSVTPVNPVGHNLDITWLLDGVAISGQTGSTLNLNTSVLSGAHEVTAVVVDDTPLVREDPAGVLEDFRSWTLEPIGGLGPPEVEFAHRSLYEEGDTLLFELPEPHSQSLPIQWSKNGVPLVDDARIGGSQTPTLSIQPLVVTDSGSYSVTFDTGTKGPAQISNIYVQVFPVGSLPAIGRTGLGVLIGGVILAGIVALLRSKRAASRSKHSQ